MKKLIIMLTVVLFSQNLAFAQNAEIKKWDGFLDVPSRRDKKIDELLK